MARHDRQTVVAKLGITAEAEIGIGVDLAQPQPLGCSDIYTRFNSLMQRAVGIEGSRRNTRRGIDVKLQHLISQRRPIDGQVPADDTRCAPHANLCGPGCLRPQRSDKLVDRRSASYLKHFAKARKLG